MPDIEAVKRANEAALLAIPGVVGVGIVDGPHGDPVLSVYVANASVVPNVPKTIAGVDVVVEVSGEFDAQKPSR